MTYTLQDIKSLRKKLGMTQADLSKKAQVSQSLIAKIEAGKIDPTFSRAKQIFDALSSIAEKNETKAEEIMNKNIITLETKDKLNSAIKKMKKYEISQLPVMEKDIVVGLISESTILAKMAEIEDVSELIKFTVSEVMSECPPIINHLTPLPVISSLLRFYPIVLVTKNGKLAGLISKADIIRKAV